jgi:Uma2 family endonuclease
MRAMSVAQQMTADEFLRLPEGWYPRGTQLIDGEVVTSDPLPLHQYVLADVYCALFGWTRAEPGRGRVTLSLDVRLDTRDVYLPDVMWYAEGRAPGRDGGRPSPIPDIAVEVRSPSTWRRDRTVKRPVYEQQGLPVLWLVDTVAQRVLVFRRSGPDVLRFDVELAVERGESLTSPLLPGFALALAELFAG